MQFSIVAVKSAFLPVVYRGSLFSMSSPILGILIIAILTSVRYEVGSVLHLMLSQQVAIKTKADNSIILHLGSSPLLAARSLLWNLDLHLNCGERFLPASPDLHS